MRGRLYKIVPFKCWTRSTILFTNLLVLFSILHSYYISQCFHSDIPYEVIYRGIIIPFLRVTTVKENSGGGKIWFPEVASNLSYTHYTVLSILGDNKIQRTNRLDRCSFHVSSKDTQGIVDVQKRACRSLENHLIHLSTPTKG